MSLTYEDLQQLNAARRNDPVEADQESHKAEKKPTLREKLELAVANWTASGNKITEIPSKPKPRPERVTGVFDDEYCGAAKTALIIAWLNYGETTKYQNGRRARLATVSGVPIHRLYNMASEKSRIRLTNREYNQLRMAMRQVEAAENLENVSL